MKTIKRLQHADVGWEAVCSAVLRRDLRLARNQLAVLEGTRGSREESTAEKEL